MRRYLAEAHRTSATGSVALHLLCSELRIPQRDQAQRDECAAGVTAPLVDHPVVVSLDTREADLEVAALEERLPAEARKGRKRDRAVDAGQRHVVDSGLRFVA